MSTVLFVGGLTFLWGIDLSLDAVIVHLLKKSPPPFMEPEG
jgi:hypothetical protein